MKNKLSSVFVMFAFVLAGLGFVQVADAQVASFPAGCTSVMGFSTTTGLACSGTGVANTTFFPGCTSVLGYSTEVLRRKLFSSQVVRQPWAVAPSQGFLVAEDRSHSHSSPVVAQLLALAQ